MTLHFIGFGTAKTWIGKSNKEQLYAPFVTNTVIASDQDKINADIIRYDQKVTKTRYKFSAALANLKNVYPVWFLMRNWTPD